jgi:hypothetical protein
MKTYHNRRKESGKEEMNPAPSKDSSDFGKPEK